LKKAFAERFVKSFLDLFVLALLAEGSKHGYQLIEELRARTNVRVGAGTLYPLLYELEKQHLVSAEWTSLTRRSRRVYEITETGKAFRAAALKDVGHLLTVDGQPQGDALSMSGTRPS
jgi:DNA-binding PadR family transcriptional regulator